MQGEQAPAGWHLWPEAVPFADAPKAIDIRLASVEASVVMRVDPSGDVYYTLQCPDWKVRQKVTRLFQEWKYEPGY